jgi:pyrroline-5-carboxylate reductase
MSLPASLLLIGAGKMGGAMLTGWLRLGLRPDQIVVIDPHASDALKILCTEKGIALNPATAGSAPEVMVLAIKPQMLDAAAPRLAPLIGARTLLVSVMAGKTIADLSGRLPGGRAIVRSMPNTPAAIGRGITGVFAGASVTEDQRATADALLRAVGRIEWVDNEHLIDAVTAVSGSGPAYVFHLVECMAEAGTKLGLPADLAMRLARATVEGAGELLFQSPEVPVAQLRINVTSPAGTTAAALDVLMGDPGLRDLMDRAIAAANRRAGALSG